MGKKQDNVFREVTVPGERRRYTLWAIETGTAPMMVFGTARMATVEDLFLACAEFDLKVKRPKRKK